MEISEINQKTQRMVAWLHSPQVQSKNGVVLSWFNPKHPGFPYDEATVLHLKLFSYLFKNTQDGKYRDIARKSCTYLREKLKNNPCVGKNGNVYLFDTSITLSTLILSKNSLKLDSKTKRRIDSIIHSQKRLIIDWFREKVPVQGRISQPKRWSNTFGCHLLKVLGLLYVNQLLFTSKQRQLFRKIAQDLIRQTFHQDHFHINEYSDEIYTHSFCYAIEGVLQFYFSGCKEYLTIARSCAIKLAEFQNTDGSLYNWYDSRQRVYKVTDALAQTIRIWILTDQRNFNKNINKGIQFLLKMTAPEGGIYYGPMLKDINSWSTIFTVQAILWYLDNNSSIKWLI